MSTNYGNLGIDFALAPNGDILITGAGTMQFLTGEQNLQQSVDIRLDTQIASYVWDSTFGWDRANGEILGPTDQTQVASDIANCLLQDSRIAQVTQVEITPGDQTQPNSATSVTASYIDIDNNQGQGATTL